MKLWQKEKTILDKDIEKFTVENDYLLDKKILKFDCIASIAHAKMLQKTGILTSIETKQFINELLKISDLAEKNDFKITIKDEDCHTAIENHLIKKLGNTGKKIHTFRSRNDQAMTAIRLYTKNEVIQTTIHVNGLIYDLKKFAKKNKNTKMPGYTHMQKAMPSSVSLWANAFVDSLSDDLKLLKSCNQLIDQNPLGSAAGYGLPIKTNREITTKLLNFKKTQKNSIYCANSRGKFEVIIIFPLSQIMIDLNKLATDILLFSTSEFGFFSLPKEFLTGSSIMPQKQNPDALEILRAKLHVVNAELFKTMTIVSNLPSGYNRDFQLTKEPLINTFETTKEAVKIAIKIISRLEVNKEKCSNAMTQELFAAEKAIKKTFEGTSFREAYKQTAKEFLQIT